MTEASLNGFPSNQIAEKIREEPYRFLVCAEKFQTGYDEPLLHTMYVDKKLSGIRAVQTLSRLNRARAGKYDAFVLDFSNDADAIREAFEPYYRTTILADETDPNKLHDLQAVLDGHQVYAPEQVDDFAERYFGDAPREELDPILDASVAAYVNDLAEDAQVEFKGRAKAFVRTYQFLAAVLPYNFPQWEKLCAFLHFLIPRLPAPVEEDLSHGILEAIDMDSYRAERQEALRIELADEDGAIEPVPVNGHGGLGDPEFDPLSAIIEDFNTQFGGIEWEDADRVRKLIREDLPKGVGADERYINAMLNSDWQNARIEHDSALGRIITSLLNDQMQLFKQYQDNPQFRQWLADQMFQLTYRPPGGGKRPP